MGIINTHPLKSRSPNRAVISGSFRPNGATGIVASTTKGIGYSVARTSAGLYTVTFDDKANDLDFAGASVRAADATATIAQVGDYSAANKTLQIRVYQSPATGTKTIHLPLGAFQEATGVALADFSGGTSNTPGWSAGDESGGIRWNNAANPDPIATQFLWPSDLDGTVAATLTIVAAKVGNTIGDATTFDSLMYNNTVAALYDADDAYPGTAASSAMTGDATSKTVQAVTSTLAVDEIPASGPAVSTISIQPTDGTLGTDDVIILGAYITYASTDAEFVLTDLASDADNVVNFMAVFRNTNVSDVSA